jgi:hypothetical protein
MLGFVEIKVSDKFAIQPELLFSTKVQNLRTRPGFSNMNLIIIYLTLIYL